jgi:hypothetical protein
MTEMEVVYNEERRKQFVAQGACPPDALKRLQDHFHTTIDKYKKEKPNGWTGMFMKWWIDTPPHGRLCLISEYKEKYIPHLESFHWIRISLELLKQVEIVINIQDIAHVRVIYKDLTIDEQFESDYDKQHYYQHGRSSLDEVYTCIYCLQKDPTVTDGHIVLYPNFSQECANSTSFLPCFTNHMNFDLPMKEGSVMILSGQTVHNIPNITGHGSMRIMGVTIYKKPM